MSKLLISNFTPEGFRPGLKGPLHEQLREVWHRLSGLHTVAHRFVALTESLDLEAWDRVLEETLKDVRIKHVDLAFSHERLVESDHTKVREHLDAMVTRLEADGIAATWSALDIPGRHFQSKGYALLDERSRDGGGMLVLTSADLTNNGFGYTGDGVMELGIWTTEVDSVGHFVELFEALRSNYSAPL